MGKPTGFKEYPKKSVPYRDARERLRDFREIFTGPPRSTCATKARAAWIAACRSANRTTAARSTTSFPSGTTWSIRAAGARRSTGCTRRTTFPSSPAAPAPRRAKAPACWASPIRPSRSRTSRTRSSIAASPKAGSTPQPPAARTRQARRHRRLGPAGPGRRGPAQQGRAQVTVYERADRIGGLLMYGIPNMKLDKGVVEPPRRPAARGRHRVRRQRRRRQERRSRRSCAPSTTRCCSTPARRSRATSRFPGRELEGIHFAMEFLTANTKSLLDEQPGRRPLHQRQGQDVIVIGGGDTGADCIGTSLRHGCKSLMNFELLDQPPAKRATTIPGRSGRRFTAPTTRTRKRSRASAPTRATTPSSRRSSRARAAGSPRYASTRRVAAGPTARRR